MKIGVLIGHPTQFEGPFFQDAARDQQNQLRVLYLKTSRSEQVYDPELNTNVSWGIDLMSGYAHATLPCRGRYRWLRDDIKHQKYDLLIINGYNRLEYWLAALLARFYRTPTALRLDSVLFNNTTKRKRLFKKVLILVLDRLYDHFFAIGTLTIEYLKFFGIRADRISIFSYVVDNKYFAEKSRLDDQTMRQMRTEHGIAIDSSIVLSVTKFSEREAPWDLLRAFCSSPPENVCLVLVGDGEQRETLQQYAMEHPSHCVIFPGYVAYSQLPSWYGMSDVFVHPVHDEPWGVSVQEALASGIPVIASSGVGSAYDLISVGENGFIYSAGDTADLLAKLTNVLRVLPMEAVRRANDRILRRWNYADAWRTIVETAQRYRCGT